MHKITNKVKKEGLDIGWSVGTKLWIGRKNKCFHIFQCTVIINNIYYPKG